MVLWFQRLLLGWFIVINLFIFVPSFVVLWDSWFDKNPTTQKPIEMPAPPTPIVLESLDTKLDAEAQKNQVEIIKQRTNVFTQQVTAYTQQVNAYKAYMEKSSGNEPNKSLRLETYRAVVKESLVSLLITLLSALVGYVFVRASANLVENYVAAKNNQPMKDLKLW